VMLFV